MEQIVADRRNKARNGGTLGSAKRMNGMDQLLSRGQFVLPLMRDNNNSDDVIQRPHKRSRVDEKENVCNGSGGDVANDVSTDDATITIEHVDDEATIGRVDDEATRVEDKATNTPANTLNTDDDNDGVAQLRELLDLMSTDVSGLAKEAASLVKNVLQQEWTSLPEGQRSRHHLWGLEKIVGMHNLLSLSDDDLARFLNCYGQQCWNELSIRQTCCLNFLQKN